MRLPKEPEDLWDVLRGWDDSSRASLFAYVVSLSVNAIVEPWNRRPRALAHADQLAQAVALDMSLAGWMPTVDTYFGRVTKARILEAVAEAKGEPAAERIAHLKKGDMAVEAENLLAGTGWLPQILRASEGSNEDSADTIDDLQEPAVEETAADSGETAMADFLETADNSLAPAAHAIAAE